VFGFIPAFPRIFAGLAQLAVRFLGGFPRLLREFIRGLSAL